MHHFSHFGLLSAFGRLNDWWEEEGGGGPSAPVNTSSPALDVPNGGLIGEEMSITSTGEWTITPDEFQYRWMVDGVQWTEKNDSLTAVITADQAGKEVYVQVRCRFELGPWSAWVSTGANNLPATAAPAFTSSLSLSSSGNVSTPQPWDYLALAEPQVSGNPSPTVSLQWQVMEYEAIPWLDISGETTSFYTLPTPSVTSRWRCKVTLSNEYGSAEDSVGTGSYIP